MPRLLLALIAAVALTGCQLLKMGEVPPGTVVERQLNELQIAVENTLTVSTKARISVLGVVDSAAMSTPAEGEVDQAALDAAAKREREVRQGLNECLVNNSLLEVVQPLQEQQDKARAAIIAANTCPLEAKVAAEAGVAIVAEYLVNALIDDAGKQVDVAVQRASDGVVVFQDTLHDWPIMATETAAEGEAT